MFFGERFRVEESLGWMEGGCFGVVWSFFVWSFRVRFFFDFRYFLFFVVLILLLVK